MLHQNWPGTLKKSKSTVVHRKCNKFDTPNRKCFTGIIFFCSTVMVYKQDALLSIFLHLDKGYIDIRECSLITGMEGGYQIGEGGGQLKYNPYKKGGRKTFSHAEIAGTQSSR